MDKASELYSEAARLHAAAAAGYARAARTCAWGEAIGWAAIVVALAIAAVALLVA